MSQHLVHQRLGRECQRQRRTSGPAGRHAHHSEAASADDDQAAQQPQPDRAARDHCGSAVGDLSADGTSDTAADDTAASDDTAADDTGPVDNSATGGGIDPATVRTPPSQ